MSVPALRAFVESVPAPEILRAVQVQELAYQAYGKEGGPMSDEEEEILPEEQVAFIGPCTCDHEPEEHSWGSCDQDGCACEAGWEE
jgi:hypothetical protein